MKKTLLFMGFTVVLGTIFALGKYVYLTHSPSAILSEKDERIKVVIDFWQQSLNQTSVENYITKVPKRFYNHTPRCFEKISPKNDELMEMTHQVTDDEYLDGLRNTAIEIGKGQFSINKISIFRAWEKEAIIDVDFAKTGSNRITEKRYFFLYLVNGNWKIFMDTNVPNLINKEYANFDCSKKVSE